MNNAYTLFLHIGPEDFMDPLNSHNYDFLKKGIVLHKEK